MCTLLIAYLPSYFDHSEYNCNHKRIWPWLIYWSGWKYIFKYFSPQLICTNKDTIQIFSSGKQHILVSHPHGVASYNHFLLMTDAVEFHTNYIKKSTHRRELIANILFRIPGLRELTLWLGCIDAGKRVAENTLSHGYSIQVYPGGEHEQLLSNPIQPILVINKRKGIARLALKYNVCIIPTFTFGEDQTYKTYTSLLPLQLWLSQQFKIALTAATGRFYIPFLPYQQQLTTVIGAPIQLPSRKNMVQNSSGMYDYTDDEVVELLELYKKSITGLFDEYKDKYSKYQINTIKIV